VTASSHGKATQEARIWLFPEWQEEERQAQEGLPLGQGSQGLRDSGEEVNYFVRTKFDAPS
jgi:hypothetical protein